jgi:pilus assembly protein CpaB
MRPSTIVMTALAAVFGLLAVFVAQSWLHSQADMRARNLDAQPAVSTQTIVVAKQSLRFGTELKPGLLIEVPWPKAALPAGAFAKISDLLGGGRRVVLAAIEANEPVLAVKVTGAGQRATLSSLVAPGMKAVTIRVNDVEGVGGFVQPGDRVDVVLTRQIDKKSATTEVVLQTAKVLAVDQSTDERATKASVPKSVTLEVDTVAAQKLALAATVGNLSLLLREAGDTADTQTRKITLSDLGSPEVAGKTKSGITTVVVTRVTQKQEYSVPVEGRSEAKAAIGQKSLRE